MRRSNLGRISRVLAISILALLMSGCDEFTSGGSSKFTSHLSVPQSWLINHTLNSYVDGVQDDDHLAYTWKFTVSRFELRKGQMNLPPSLLDQLPSSSRQIETVRGVWKLSPDGRTLVLSELTVDGKKADLENVVELNVEKNGTVKGRLIIGSDVHFVDDLAGL